MEPYDHKALENKWQKYWEENNINQVDLDKAQKPFYNLMMFPYPSAEGLHVGNLFAFVGSDIQGRYHRLLGYDVFEPMGFDAFGMHSENFALQTGRHPAEMVPENIERFREKQMKKVGLMLDWSHQVDTTQPNYYKWTQWLFVQLYKNDLAYRKKGPVNWCPDCQTVLAAEQVIEGLCERCETAVTKKDLTQWYFKTTAFAKELLENLDVIDWDERTKMAQKNWIGRSYGSEVTFKIAQQEKDFKIFTTRPDTLFGVTYMVFSPEHPLLSEITSSENIKTLEKYKKYAANLSEIDRQTESREKTGVFTGAYAINPVNNEKIPIWVSDYVLMGYGTGAIMAVPAHDQRDFEFAQKFNLEIRQVISSEEKQSETKLTSAYTDEGSLINSDKFNGLLAKEEGIKAINDFLEEKNLAEFKVNYRLRDWCVSRQRYWGPPIPIIYCESCGTLPVPEENLPVLLPPMKDYTPSGGQSPLKRNLDFYHTICPKCQQPAVRETDVSDNFLCSSWYFYRYPSTDFNDRPFDKERNKKWLPVDLYVGGNEHAVLHLLYSRWLCMALKQCGFIDFAEPYKRFIAHGMIVRDGAKMSKSKGNVINPDEYIKQYGADAFRVYLMFMGAYLEGGDFRDNGVKAMHSFLERFWNAVLPNSGEKIITEEVKNPETLFWLHSTIKAVTFDIKRFSYNTALARIMELVNHINKEKIKYKVVSDVLIKLIAPFAPHLAEELWQQTITDKSKTFKSVFDNPWPKYDEKLTQKNVVEYVIQVNGKVRAKIEVETGLSEETIEKMVMDNPQVSKWLENKKIVRKIFVPDKLVNIVIK